MLAEYGRGLGSRTRGFFIIKICNYLSEQIKPVICNYLSEQMMPSALARALALFVFLSKSFLFGHYRLN